MASLETRLYSSAVIRFKISKTCALPSKTCALPFDFALERPPKKYFPLSAWRRDQTRSSIFHYLIDVNICTWNLLVCHSGQYTYVIQRFRRVELTVFRGNPDIVNFKAFVSSIFYQIFIFFTKMIALKSCVRYAFASLVFSLNESPCRTRKNAFYFTSKALFVLEKIKF